MNGYFFPVECNSESQFSNSNLHLSERQNGLMNKTVKAVLLKLCGHDTVCVKVFGSL